MLMTEKCVSPHVAMPQNGYRRLDWRTPYRGLERVRPTAWTCGCRATVYELCEGGGQAFIRRTVQLDSGHEIHETPCWPIPEARTIWTALLTGRAR
ncbi:hypothetical protein [Streptosporangium carneum]|uniref:Uncharacterized protein n=1 Tax=Streptosporangium carneum TaxID=47481 RepID=A0A9W6HZY8_9ACTN|nr:hypothetical protein [Streptosporangium carneum]GLK08663.1 hypothetical protein GCM10017600_20680 [Streptosporangium carneum]